MSGLGTPPSGLGGSSRPSPSPSSSGEGSVSGAHSKPPADATGGGDPPPPAENPPGGDGGSQPPDPFIKMVEELTGTSLDSRKKEEDKRKSVQEILKKYKALLAYYKRRCPELEDKIEELEAKISGLEMELALGKLPQTNDTLEALKKLLTQYLGAAEGHDERAHKDYNRMIEEHKGILDHDTPPSS